MLKLPIYLRNSSYYLHTRINGKQVKRSLNTSDQLTAIMRASQLLQSARMPSDSSHIKTFEIDLSRGLLKADVPEDHARMLEALALLKAAHIAPNAQPAPSVANYNTEPLPQAKSKSGLKLLDLIDKFFLLKSQQARNCRRLQECRKRSFSLPRQSVHTRHTIVGHSETSRTPLKEKQCENC